MVFVNITYKKREGQLFTLNLPLRYSTTLPYLCILEKVDLINIFNAVTPLKSCFKFPGIHAGFDLVCGCCDEKYRFDIIVGDFVTTATLLEIGAPSKGEFFVSYVTKQKNINGEDFFLFHF